MRSKLGIVALIAAAATTIVGQSQNPIPKDDGYVSAYRPTPSGGGPENKTKDDPLARLEDMRERMSGDLTPEFMEGLMAAADEQRTQYGPDGGGAIKPATGGRWTNIGPFRSNWIQNGLRVNESDTGRTRAFLIHPTSEDIVYTLTSSGG